MSSASQNRDLVAARELGSDRHGAAESKDLGARAPIITVTNVVPFTRLRRASVAAEPASELKLDLSQRPAPQWFGRDRRWPIVILFALSLLAHGGLYALFNREPEPMASIGLEVISVEIVLGAKTPAGLAANPGENEVQSPTSDDVNAVEKEPDAKPEPPAETPPVQTAQSDPPERSEPPVATEPSPEPEKPVAAAPVEPEPSLPPPEPEKQQIAALPAEPEPTPREPEVTVAPEQPKVEPPVRDTVAPKPVPNPVQKRETRPKREREIEPKQDRPRKTARTDPNPTGARPQAGGIGIGGSHSAGNYNGLVSAHLQRHKRYPAEARSRNEQGTATVSFALDGGGRVTRVALVRGTGFASLDQEVQAMVRRASPFPAPPSGRSMSFTVPVSFRFQ